MKKTQWLCVGGMIIVLSGCSTMSRMAPWNWFGSDITVSEQGVGGLSDNTPMTEEAISQGLNGDYRLARGMRMVNGQPASYYEALKDNNTALTITGESGHISRIDVLDSDIETAEGVRIGTPFTSLYSKAFGVCRPIDASDVRWVSCNAPGSKHVSYEFSGQWNGPQGLMPPDDTLTHWTLTKIVWQR